MGSRAEENPVAAEQHVGGEDAGGDGEDDPAGGGNASISHFHTFSSIVLLCESKYCVLSDSEIFCYIYIYVCEYQYVLENKGNMLFSSTGTVIISFVERKGFFSVPFI